MTAKYNDYPFDEVVKAAEELAGQGWEVFQKFTCEKCGQRLTIDEPNHFHTTGTCDKCGHLTDIQARGCNYLLVGKMPKTA